MYKLNSGFRWTCSTQMEEKIANFSFELEERDCNLLQLEAQLLNQDHNDIKLSKFTKLSSEKQLEYLLSNLLKYGVLMASFVVLWGGILYLISHGSEPAQYQLFIGTPSKFHSPTGVINAVLGGSARGIIQLGLLMLVGIPILRVMISFLTFVFHKDFIYVIITLLVLASLTYSLVAAYY